MIKNFLHFALRHLLKRKGYSVLNILGLAAGIACCLLILVCDYENDYDGSFIGI